MHLVRLPASVATGCLAGEVKLGIAQVVAAAQLVLLGKGFTIAGACVPSKNRL